MNTQPPHTVRLTGLRFKTSVLFSEHQRQTANVCWDGGCLHTVNVSNVQRSKFDLLTPRLQDVWILQVHSTWAVSSSVCQKNTEIQRNNSTCKHQHNLRRNYSKLVTDHVFACVSEEQRMLWDWRSSRWRVIKTPGCVSSNFILLFLPPLIP